MLAVQVDEEFKTLIREAVREALREAAAPSGSWQERLWVVPNETRLGVAEVAEAVGRSKACVYRWTRLRLIPVRRLDGELSFTAGDVKLFITEREEAA
jgi:hypothetical protein